jgi:hypothetical protein
MTVIYMIVTVILTLVQVATYPKRVSSFVVGTTYEGRPMKAYKVALDSAEPKPTLWFDGGIHAR